MVGGRLSSPAGGSRQVLVAWDEWLMPDAAGRARWRIPLATNGPLDEARGQLRRAREELLHLVPVPRTGVELEHVDSARVRQARVVVLVRAAGLEEASPLLTGLLIPPLAILFVYAVVLMVTQGGTGGGTAAPSVRAIYEAIFGVEDGRADPGRDVPDQPARRRSRGRP